ncbi:MAG: MFS transporter [Spirochaetaceae bacterium]|jgi:HEAT repeat protein/Na+/melibiose symporter-like transporter|nr:MFS transporter [Spirochaetaceae bacterium]
MSGTLSPYRLAKARDAYNIFNIFNSLSWQFLVGTIIILLAMRLNASSTVIGLINAMVYMAFFFLPLGKILAGKISLVKIYGTAWILRALGMSPVLLVPAAVSAGRADIGVGLILLGVFIFHASRGVGMIANNPVLDLMAAGPDRGGYMTQVQIINSATVMFASFAIAMALGREPPLFLYSVIIALGIAGGVMSGAMALKFPDPGANDERRSTSFFGIFREAFSRPPIKHFIIVLVQVIFVSGIARAFITVYAREVFSQGDGMVSLYSVFGGMGNLLIGLLIKFLVDRIGVKPIYIVCTIVGLVGMIPIVFFPPSALDNTPSVILYLTFIFLIINFGFLGAEGIAQTYFLALIPAEFMMDMGILYFFMFGVSGAAGSFLAGIVLDALTGVGVSHFISYKILYGGLIVMTVGILALQRKLAPLGSLPFRGALEVMFSPRDLKAITLLEKLNKSQDTTEEEALLDALHDTPSHLSLKGLLRRARSPRLTVRQESIRALGALQTLNEDAETALMADLINNPYTTAYYSARILGTHGCIAAIPLLRELVLSEDYMLAGEAMIALARLKDEAFRPQIEELIATTHNPRLKIMGVEAFGIYGSPNSLSALLDVLRGANPPPYLRDQVVLSMASILNTQNQFYHLLVRFLEDTSLAATLAMDEAEAAVEVYHSALGGRKTGEKKRRLEAIDKQAKILQPAVSAYVREQKGALLSRWILELPEEIAGTQVAVILSEAVLDGELLSHRRLQLLIAHWSAQELRAWTRRMKG